jgi:hypothetical protein
MAKLNMSHVDALPASMRMPLARQSISPQRAWPLLATISQKQGTHHERLPRLSLVWWRRAAQDPWRGSPLLFRYMSSPLARDLPQADGRVARSLFYRATAALKINPEIKKGIARNAPNRNIPIVLCSATYILSQSH